MGIENVADTLENSLAVPQIIKHRVIYDQEISLLYINSREMKTYTHAETCTQYTNAYDNIICKSQMVETAQKFIMDMEIPCNTYEEEIQYHGST